MRQMELFLIDWEPYVLSVLRIVSGFLFLPHGTQKLFGYPAPPPGGKPPLGSLYGVAGLVEFCGGVLTALLSLGFLLKYNAQMTGIALGFLVVLMVALSRQTGEQLNRRFRIPESVVQVRSLLSLNVADYCLGDAAARKDQVDRPQAGFVELALMR